MQRKSRINKTKWIQALFLACSFLVLSQITYAEERIEEKEIWVTCSSSGQVCSPPGSVTLNLPKSAIVALMFATPERHCSSISVAITGDLEGSTDFLSAGEQTGILDTKILPSGNYSFSITATGQEGGCNYGELNSWGGIVIFFIEDEDWREKNFGNPEC